MGYLQQNEINAIEMNFGMELGSPEALKGAVEAGMGISILSRSTIEMELKLNSLAEVQLDPPLSRPFSFVCQRQKFSVGLVEELLEFARGYCQSTS
jgi:DNA-binding transcriptional LysR family regulator